MESIFKLGIVLSVLDRVSGPSAKMGQGMIGLRGKVMSLGPAFDKFKTYGLLVFTVAAGMLSMMSNTAMATTGTQKALGELSSVGIENLQALENAGTEFSGKWSGTTKAEFISAAYDIKSGISSLTDEGVAEFAKLAALTGKATKSTTAEMTSLFATGYGIYKGMYEDLTDMQFGEVFSAGISASVKNFKTTGSGMAQSISQLGAAATTAKVPLAEQLTILGMLQATMSGSEAGTKYKAVMQSAAGAGQKLGLQFMDANNQLLSMPEILASLQGKYGTTLDAMEKMEMQKAFGTQEAVAVIDLLYGKVGDLKTNITELSGAMDKGTAFTEQMATAMNMDIGAGVGLLSQIWHNLVEVIGNQFIPILVPLFSWIGTLMNRIIAFAGAHETLTRILVVGIGIFAVVAFALSGLATVFGAVGLLLPQVSLGFSMAGKAALFMKTGLLSAVASTKTWILWQRQALLTSLYFHGGVLGLARSLATSFLSSIGAAITAVWSFTVALLANPVTWVVVGVIALGAAIYGLYKKFEIVKTGVNAFLYVLGYLFGVWVKMGKGIVNAFLHPLDSVNNGFTGLKNSLKKMISWVKGIIPEFLASGKALWGAFSDGIKSTASAPFDFVKNSFAKIGNLMPHSGAKEGPLSTLTLSGARMMETIGVGIQSAGPGLIKGVSGMMAGVAAVFGIGSDLQLPPRVDNIPALISERPKAAVVRKKEITKNSGDNKKEVHIHINGLTLPDVNDTESFIAKLQELAGGYDV